MIRNFLAELRRRHVLQTTAWYIGGGVFVVEASNNFLPALGVPEAALRLLTIAALFGLPVAIAFSWEFDVFSATPAVRPHQKWLRAIPIAFVAVVCLTGALLVWRHNTNPAAAANAATTPRADPAHVAVLPFTAMAGNIDLTTFAFNLQMRLIDGLSIAAATGAQSSQRLRVVSRPTIQPFSRPDVTLDSIWRALNVGTVLDGTVEAVGDAVRVRIRLVDAETGDQLATSVTEKSARNRLALLDAVSDSVLLLIRQQLGVVVRDRMRRLETRNPEAFNRFASAMRRLDDFYQAGSQKDFTVAYAVIDDADSLLAQAERLDPGWIEPTVERGQLARKRVMLATGHGGAGRADFIADGLRHANRALQVHPDDYRALELRSQLRLLLLRYTTAPSRRAVLADSAERDLRLSLVSNPTPATCYRLLSELASTRGQLEQAVEYGVRAYTEDPYLDEVQSTVFRLFEYSFALGRDADAARWCSEGRKRFGIAIFDDCRLSLAAWSRHGMRPDSARLVAEHELSTYPALIRTRLEPRLATLYAAILARNRMPDSARVVLAGARRRDSGAGVLWASAGVYALIGQRDSALLMVRKLLAITPDARGALDTSPELRSLRSDPAFRQLIEFAD